MPFVTALQEHTAIFLRGDEPGARDVSHVTRQHGIGPASIVGLLLTRLDYRGFPAHRAQELFRLVYCTKPRHTRIRQRLDKLPRPLGSEHGAVDGVKAQPAPRRRQTAYVDRKSTRLNSSHVSISYA